MIDADDPRVRMAAERTLLAWIRTGLAVMAFGFVVARHEDPRPDSTLIGFFLILLGSLALGVGARDFARVFRTFPATTPPEDRLRALAVRVASVLAALGLVLAAFLLARAWASRGHPL